ncbi:hypothetical protein ALFP_1761 [Alcaligenes faecalis]|nr:hypothetical protein ALFP_1761 [Alcaligenes faecalis]
MDGLETWHDKALAVIKAPSIWASLIVFIIAILGARVGARKTERLEKNLKQSKLDAAAAKLQAETARRSLDEAEQHAEFLRQKFDELLTRGAASFLKRHVRDINEFGDHARVSLYAHTDSQFILAGRFTEHPEFIKPNRQRFPDNQGCIGSAWLNGGECFLELPDPVSRPEEYTDALRNECGIRKTTAKNLRMQSSFYYAKAINSDTMRAGVIVYESTRANILIKEQLSRLSEQDEEHLARIIEQARFVNPFMMIQRGREE